MPFFRALGIIEAILRVRFVESVVIPIWNSPTRCFREFAMQLTVFRLAPLLGLHAIVCLFQLNARPAFAWWINHSQLPKPPTLNAPWEMPLRVQPIQP
jgi:hypothetical protein